VITHQSINQSIRRGLDYLLTTIIGPIKSKMAEIRHLENRHGVIFSASIAERWQEHFSTLLNRPTQSPPDALVSEAQASTPDSTIGTFPPTITEVYKAMNKIKAGKAPGVCGIYPEYIQHGGSDALRTLHKIVTEVWKEEVVPEEWHQGIIIPLYKGKGSKSECSNYRGITLL